MEILQIYTLECLYKEIVEVRDVKHATSLDDGTSTRKPQIDDGLKGKSFSKKQDDMKVNNW